MPTGACFSSEKKGSHFKVSSLRCAKGPLNQSQVLVAIVDGLFRRRLCAQKVSIHGKASFQTIPEPCDEVKALLDALDITMPDAIPDRGVVVSTRKKLPENRVKQ